MSAEIFIGLPVRNGARYVRTALDSVLRQTFKRWTLLVSDNDSTDNTASIVEQYAVQDSRVRLTSKKCDVGPISNFIACAQACPPNVSYFVWFAHDDVWQPEFLEATIGLLERYPHVSFAWTNVYSLDGLGQYQGVSTDFSRYASTGPWAAARFVMEHEVCGKAMLVYSVFRSSFLRTVLDAMPSNYHETNWDNVFNLACLARGHVVVDRRHLFGKRAPRHTDALGYVDPWTISFDRRLGLDARSWHSYFSALRHVVAETRYESLLMFLINWRRWSRQYYVPRQALARSDIRVR